MIKLCYIFLALSSLAFSHCTSSNFENAKNDQLNILIVGQSQSRGNSAYDGGDHTINASTQVWTGAANGFQALDPSIFGNQWGGFNATDSPNGELRNVLWWHFAKKFNEVTGQEVRVVVDAVGGYEVERWLEVGTEDNNANGAAVVGTRVNNLYNKIDQSGLGQFDIVFFIQGEANSIFNNQGNQTWEEYKANIDQLRQNLINRGSITSDTFWFVADQSPIVARSSRYNTEWQSIGEPYNLISWKDMPTESVINIHFNGETHVKAGRVMAWQLFLHGSETVHIDIETVNGMAKVKFCGDKLLTSLDTYNWSEIIRATSPYTEPLIQKKFYKTIN